MVGVASTTTATSTFGGISSAEYTEQANYLPLPDTIIGVNKVFKMDSSTISAGMFNIKYQIFLNDLYYYGAIDLLNYGMVKSYLETLDSKKSLRKLFCNSFISLKIVSFRMSAVASKCLCAPPEGS